MTLTAAFNPAGKSSGDNIATADTGDLTAWQAVSATPPTYDNAHTLFGKSLAAKIITTATANFLEWTTSFGSTAETYGRLYLYLSALPTGTTANIVSDLSSKGCEIAITTAGKIVLLNNGTPQLTSTTTLSAGQWNRIEWHFLNSGGGAGSGEVKIYTSPNSSVADETMTKTAITVATPTVAAYGVTNNSVTLTYWLAQIVEKATAYPGPFPVSTTAPTVSGSAPVGSTLTCDGGTWNSGATFTLTYQWTRDGGNIASATSSSYTTVSADSGHAIGCTVTATGIQATNESASQASSNTITATSSSSSSFSGADPSKTAPAMTVLGL